ncbi:TPA: hypothetical protein ACH3X1_008213 [Trebouxia sp. C0004]
MQLITQGLLEDRLRSGLCASPGASTDMKKHFDITSRFQMVLKCADIGHLAAPPGPTADGPSNWKKSFSDREDKERACGMPVSPLMDRSTQGGMTRSQLGFFSIVGIPLFKAMVDLFEDAKPMLDGVLATMRIGRTTQILQICHEQTY